MYYSSSELFNGKKSKNSSKGLPFKLNSSFLNNTSMYEKLKECTSMYFNIYCARGKGSFKLQLSNSFFQSILCKRQRKF